MENTSGIYHEQLKEFEGLVIFEIANFEYCSDIKNVAAILDNNEISRLNQHDLKIIEYHKLNFNIVDLHGLYNNTPIKKSVKTRLILCEMFNKRFCFYVDCVKEIISIDKIFFEKSLKIINYSVKNFIKFKLKYQDRVIFIPDFEKISNYINELNNFSCLA